jgi:sugar phosphate isomerase/epimerase
MRLRFYKTLWGMEALPVAERVAKVAEAGYDGFEGVMPDVLEARRSGVDVPAVGMIFPLDFEGFQRGFDEAEEARVDKLVVHAGKDWWSFDQGAAFFDAALEVVESANLPVAFETHRGRLLFEPQSTLRYLDRFPTMRLCADFSHWTCVCESMLDDQMDAVRRAAERTIHLHARIGHEEGPQVPDPRTPRWQPYVERFEAMWDLVHAAHRERGEDTLTIDPEFGPPHYLWTDPADERPLADLFEVTNFVRDRLVARWATL